MPGEARARSKIISDALGIPSIVADVMAQREIENPGEAEAFLRADLMDLEDPNLLKDMGKAVERIVRGIEDGEKIVVYGEMCIRDRYMSTFTILCSIMPEASCSLRQESSWTSLTCRQEAAGVE